MLPAHQRLDAEDLAAGELDDRLVVHAQLAPLQGAPQLVLDAQRRHGALVHRGVEDRVPAAAHLGPVHRGVRVSQKVFDPLGSGAAERDADGGAGEDFVPFDHVGGHQRAVDALRDGDGLLVGRDPLHQQREFVAAQARHRVAGAPAALQSPCDLHEELVARAVAEAVVDQLEPVQIEEEHREAGRLASLGAREGDLQAVLEQRAVGEAGERIVEGCLQQPRLRLAAGRHVRGGDQQRAAALEDHLVDGELQVVRFSGGGAVAFHGGRTRALLGGGAGIEPQVR